MVQVHHPQCPYCHTPVTPTDAKVACDRCMSWQHSACWEEHGKCATCTSSKRLARVTDELAASLLMPRPARAESEPLAPRPPPWDCPRCTLYLTAGHYEEQQVQSCDGCIGYWLSESACREIAIRRDAYFSRSERNAVLKRALDCSVTDADPNLPCPMCTADLAGWSLGGVLLYRCRGHGVWLDTGDLKRMQILVEGHVWIRDLLLGDLPPRG